MESRVRLEVVGDKVKRVSLTPLWNLKLRWRAGFENFWGVLIPSIDFSGYNYGEI